MNVVEIYQENKKSCYFCKKKEPETKATFGQIALLCCNKCYHKNKKLFDKSEKLKKGSALK